MWDFLCDHFFHKLFQPFLEFIPRPTLRKPGIELSENKLQQEELGVMNFEWPSAGWERFLQVRNYDGPILKPQSSSHLHNITFHHNVDPIWYRNIAPKCLCFRRLRWIRCRRPVNICFRSHLNILWPPNNR